MEDIEIVGRGGGTRGEGKSILLGLVGLHQMEISGLVEEEGGGGRGKNREKERKKKSGGE